MDLVNIQFNNNRRRKINKSDNSQSLTPFWVGLIIGFFIVVFILIILFSIFF
jgi:flagellar biosynthesis/type III secretory pathway M-ring protein FliF/YscJ